MREVQLKWTAAAVVALLLLWVGSRLLPSGTDRPAAGFRLPVVSADSMDSVVVVAPDDTVVLVRDGAGAWTASGYQASADAVAEFFAALAEDATLELVARSAGSFARLGVADSAARQVRVVTRDRTVAHLLVSERGPDFQSAHVRAADDSSVYVVRGRFATVARRGLDDWRDKTIAAVDPDSVAEIELRRGGRRSLLRRRGGTWTLDGRAADSSAAHQLVQRYRLVTGGGFPSRAQRDITFRGAPERRATLRDPRGAVLVQLEFDSAGGGFWARRTGDTTVFRINRWDVDGLVPADSAFRGRD